MNNDAMSGDESVASNVPLRYMFHRELAIGRWILTRNGSFKKKVYHDLDLVEKCGFLHGVQHVSNNIFETFLDIAKF